MINRLYVNEYERCLAGVELIWMNTIQSNLSELQ